MQRCSHILENGKRCVRKVIDGECYQHRTSNIFDISDITNLMASYLSDLSDIENFLESNKLRQDPNVAMINLMKNLNFGLPVGYYNGKSFEHDFESVRRLFLENYKYDILPKIVEKIRSGEPGSKVYGFEYQKGKKIFSQGTAANVFILDPDEEGKHIKKNEKAYNLVQKIEENPIIRLLIQPGDVINYQGDKYLWKKQFDEEVIEFSASSEEEGDVEFSSSEEEELDEEGDEEDF